MVVSTAFPATRRARGVGIETKYVQLGAAGTKYRPVRIAVLAQADANYAGVMTKRQVFTKEEVGDLYGYQSPLYLIVRNLLPSNGDGVGDIPVWVYPLTVGTGVQSVGDITPSGTQTKTQTYFVEVNNLRSGPITLYSGENLSDFCEKAVLAINGVIGMPGVATNTCTPGTITDTTTYPVADQDGLTEKVTIDGGTEQTVTFSGAHTTAVQIAASMDAQLTGCSVAVVGGQVVITSDSTGAGSSVAIGTGTCALAWDAPVAGIDGELVFTAGWDGSSGDNIYLEVVAPDDAEMSFLYTQPTGGGGTIDVEAAGEGLNLIGEAWDTHIITGLDYDDDTNLDKLELYGEGRWAPAVRKPLIAFTGSNEATLATLTAVTDARKDDRTNVIVTNPGSNDLPFIIAADHVRRIAVRANTNPPYDYGGLKCSALSPGIDSVQWNSSQRDTAVKAGLSTTEIKDGSVRISDVVTCYHPTGEDPPAYSCPVDIEKIATMIYQFELEFGGDKWLGCPLIPDSQASKNPAAKKPKDARAAMGRIFDASADDAIISDPDFAKANSDADISSVNPKRLDIVATFKLSGNVNVLPITLQFGFYYGG